MATPTLVLVGDDDLIELSHTASLYESLPAGRLAVVPGTSHAVPLEAPAEVAHLVLDFIAAPDPPTTAIPARRAATDAFANSCTRTTHCVVWYKSWRIDRRGGDRGQTRRPRARLITRRWTSLVPSPISRILASR